MNATTGWVAGSVAVFSAGTDATGAFSVTLSGTQTATGVVVEEGTVSYTGSGSVSLAGNNISVSPGATLSIDNSARIATTAGSKLFLNGSTMRNTVTAVNGTFLDTDTEIVLGTNGGTLSYTTANTLNIVQTATKITGVGALTKTGAGVLAIASTAGNNTYTGGTVVLDGELRIRTAANPLPTTTAMTVTSPGILNLNSVSQQVGSLSGNGGVGLGSATLTISGPDSTTFTGVIENVKNAGAGGVTTGNGRIAKSGSGTLTLTGLNTYAGSFTISAGTVTVTSTGSLCGPIADLTVNGGTLNLENATQTVENISGTGGTINLSGGHVLVTDPIASSAFAGVIAGAGGLEKRNVLSGTTNRTLTLSGNNSYTGITQISGGNIAVGSATALGSTVGNTVVSSGAEVVFTGATTNFTVNEAFTIAGAGNSDSGAIAVLASATPTLTGSITLAGNSTVTVSGASAATFSNPQAFVSLAGESLTLQGGSGAGAGGTITGSLVLGSGSLNKLQGGKWVLSGANNYTGPTNIGAGTLQFAKQTSLYNNVPASWTDTNIVVSSGATMALNVGGVGEFTSSDVNVIAALGSATGGFASGSALAIDTTNAVAGTFTHAGIIANPNGGANTLGLTKVGTGTLVLSSANTYTGTTLVQAGTLAESATGSIADTSNLTVNGSTAVFALGADHSDTVGTVTLQGGGSITGSGTSTLTVGAGSFALQSGSVSANLAGLAIPLNKTTAGSVTLSGENTFTGATTITAGSLFVNGSLTGTLKVDISGILGGTGTISPALNGSINVLANGKVAPGTNEGTLTVNLSGTGIFDLRSGIDVPTGALQFELGTTLTSDKIVLSGGPLEIGSQLLNFDDFAFTSLAGFGNGDYLLIDTSSPISGLLGTSLTGTVNGFDAEIQFADGGKDVILHVVPEPGSATLLLGGLAATLIRRRRDRSEV